MTALQDRRDPASSPTVPHRRPVRRAFAGAGGIAAVLGLPWLWVLGIVILPVTYVVGVPLAIPLLRSDRRPRQLHLMVTAIGAGLSLLCAPFLLHGAEGVADTIAAIALLQLFGVISANVGLLVARKTPARFLGTVAIVGPLLLIVSVVLQFVVLEL